MSGKQQAIVQAAGVLAGVALVDLIVGVLVGMLNPKPPLIVLGTVGGVMSSLVGASLLTRFGAWRASGIWRLAHPVALLWFVPLLIYALLPLSQGVRVTPAVAALGGVFALSIGFWKLAGLALAVLLLAPFGRWGAAGIAGLLFGLTHLLGLLVGAAALPTLMNALASGLLGFAVAALALRTGMLWPAVVLYSLLLFSVAVTGGLDTVNMATSVAALLPAVVISGLLAAIGAAALAGGPRAGAMPARGSAQG